MRFSARLRHGTFPLALAIFAVALFPLLGAGALADQIDGYCGGASLVALIDAPSGNAMPCTVGGGTILLESLYYQNASKVGGTALAAYPLIRLRGGISSRLDLTLDSPSQVAESGLRGAGLHPSSRGGFGAAYEFAQGDRTAIALNAEIEPPASCFAPSQTQSKYNVDVSAGYRLTDHLSFDGSIAGVTSRSTVFQRIFPASTFGVGHAVGPNTLLSSDLGTRFLARRTSPQSFGDLAIAEALRRNVIFDLGLGTAFNPVSNVKAHYLAAGFDYFP